MRREIDLALVSDGRRYQSGDMVKTDCGGCQGCSACCQGMGDSILLDPYDIYSLCRGLGQSFEQLLSYALELHLADGVILPSLKMTGEREVCVFLNQEGRCAVHGFRPGFCRMFPLGRIYEGDGFQYFLQVQECKKEPKTKIKVSKWLGISNLKAYEAFILQWHVFLKQTEEMMRRFQDQNSRKQISMFLLKTFYFEPYNPEQDFYAQFQERMRRAETYFR